jgi:hypothetical protein
MGRGSNAIVERKNTKYKRMTAAQTKARARFKAAVNEAGKLRKKNPKLSQADAVKQAFAILYGKARTGKKVGAPAKKTVRKPAAKKAAPVKKCAPKKPATHSDSKSHNVNIRVMSGTSNYVLWGVKVGMPDWDETILLEMNDEIKITDALRKKALEKGYNRLRVAKIDMREKPDFVKTVKGKMNGILKTYIILFDTGNNFETVKIQAVDMRAARAMASRVKRDDPKLKKARTSVRLFRK